MRKYAMITAAALLLLGGCEKKSQEGTPTSLQPAQIAPSPEVVDPPEESKGVGAAGCASPACEEACEGFEQPECAEAFIAGCFTQSPPANKGCEKFAGKPSSKADEGAGRGAAGMGEGGVGIPKRKSKQGGTIEIIAGEGEPKLKLPTLGGSNAGFGAMPEAEGESEDNDESGAKATPIGD